MLLRCAESFLSLINTRYIIHLGRSGKLVSFKLSFDQEDAHHLMGLHYLSDRYDPRNRAKIFSDILHSPEYRKYLSSSNHWTPYLENRVICTSFPSEIIENNGTIIRYNPKRHNFHSKISAEYLISFENNYLTSELSSDIYLFIDKRADSNNRFCKSIFPKDKQDFTANQAIWTLLYKEKLYADNSKIVLYKHKNYVP